MTISRVSNHPVHMVDEEGNINPSSFIPFCSFGDNQFFNNLSDYNPELGMPVCDKFRPTMLDGRLCYRVTMDSFGQDITTQSGRGAGLNFIMDYNTERMEQDIEQQQHIENREAMIYIETIGRHNFFLHTYLFKLSSTPSFPTSPPPALPPSPC